MTDFNNDYKYYYPNHITKSNITRDLLNKMHIPKHISVKHAKECFDKCELTQRSVVVGNPYNKYQQKHIKIVSKNELYRKIIKD